MQDLLYHLLVSKAAIHAAFGGANSALFADTTCKNTVPRSLQTPGRALDTTQNMGKFNGAPTPIKSHLVFGKFYILVLSSINPGSNLVLYELEGLPKQGPRSG